LWNKYAGANLLRRLVIAGKFVFVATSMNPRRVLCGLNDGALSPPVTRDLAGE
jgi:hypothetical protein